MGFNEAQINAINHNKGPMLVLAGPGSGKTTVITRRTVNLVEGIGVDPTKILVITFTKAAANEMEERFNKLMKGVNTPVYFGTFHAVFFRILKFAYRYNANNIIRDDQRRIIFKEIISKLEIELDDEDEFMDSIMSEISLVKGDMINIDNYYSMNGSEEIFKKIYTEYDERLRRANLIDFDDMLVMCYELFKQRKDILSAWQNKFKYILIDEFQDINKVQYEIIRMLALPENNLFIVGDDDQSIYRFRGAKPEIMLNFQNDYPDTKKVLLSINYRSVEKIVKGAIRVVKNNKNRFTKDISTINPEGKDIIIKKFKESKDENNHIIDDIIGYKKKGINYSEIAILYRTNTQPRTLLSKLMEYNIPFKIKDNIPNIYEHWIAKNIMAYIKIALGDRERGSFLQIINKPKRYISRDIFNEPTVSFDKLKDSFSDKKWMIEKIDKLEYDLKLIKEMNPYAAINYIRKGVGYDEYLIEYAKFRRIKPQELIDILNEIQDSSRAYKDFSDWFKHIEQYTNELKEQASKGSYNTDAVSMVTMHGSKGLEYKTVIIIDTNEGIIPHHKAATVEDIEEERRMFYVAMTRAKEYLHIYYLEERFGKELEMSRFLGELMIDRDMLAKGVIIEHKTYGRGQIKAIEDGKLYIFFEKMKKDKILDMNYCINSNLITVIN